MVNTGHPSRDCETCRQRRVKCDLRRPFCQRCEKIGRPCSGYRDLSKPKLRFRIQTPSTFVDRKRHPHRTNGMENRSMRYLLDCPEHDSVPIQGNQASPQRSPSTISESWDLHIMPWIVYSFSFQSPQGHRVRGSFECFPDLLRTAHPGSVLDLVSRAVGYAYFANRTHSREPLIRHRKLYCLALHELQVALLDPAQQKQDAILFAVWLACLYELMPGNPYAGPHDGLVNWDIHARALGKLLQLRGFRQFGTKTGCQLFQLSYHIIQIESLNSITDPASESREWFSTIQSCLGTNELFFLPTLFYGDEAVRICRRAHSSYTAATSTLQRLESISTLVQDCRRLEVTFEGSVEEPFSPSSCTTDTVPSTSACSVRTTHRGERRIHNHVDACLLRAYAIVLELISSTAELPDLSDQSIEYLMLLQHTMTVQSQSRANRILHNLFALLPVDDAVPSSWAESLTIMWPLRMIVRSPAPDPESKQSAISALRRIAYRAGLMQALASFSRESQLTIDS